MESPNPNSTPEQLAAIERHLTETYYGDTRDPAMEIHESKWLAKCADRVTEGRSNLRWLVPLCEKSPAMKWLYDQGHHVIGAELVGKAIEEFFDKYDIKFTKSDLPGLKFGCLYQSEDKKIQIFKCNFFDITRELIGGPIDAVWDRGSLQAIAGEDTKRYSEVILSLLPPSGRILAETFDVTEVVRRAAAKGESQTTASEVADAACSHGDTESHQLEAEESLSHSVTPAIFQELYGERCTIEVLATECWKDWEGHPCDQDQPPVCDNTIRLITLIK